MALNDFMVKICEILESFCFVLYQPQGRLQSVCIHSFLALEAQLGHQLWCPGLSAVAAQHLPQWRSAAWGRWSWAFDLRCFIRTTRTTCFDRNLHMPWFSKNVWMWMQNQVVGMNSYFAIWIPIMLGVFFVCMSLSITGKTKTPAAKPQAPLCFCLGLQQISVVGGTAPGIGTPLIELNKRRHHLKTSLNISEYLEKHLEISQNLLRYILKLNSTVDGINKHKRPWYCSCFPNASAALLRGPLAMPNAASPRVPRDATAEEFPAILPGVKRTRGTKLSSCCVAQMHTPSTFTNVSN